MPVIRQEYAYTAPCPYVPLSQYNWKSYNPHSPPGCGILAWNPVVFSLFAAFQAGTYLIAIELNLQLFFQFRKKSLYFWSILITSWGAILFASSSLVLQYVAGSAVYGTVLMNIAWVAMTTGFSFVLYSRLNLLHPPRLLMRGILTAVLVNILLFHVPVFIMRIVSNARYTESTWKASNITSYTEIAFTVQETLLTTLYIYLFLKETNDRRAEVQTRIVLYQLLVAEFVVFTTDITVNVLLYTEHYLSRAMIQSFAVVLKLRIEFAILNSLRVYSRSKLAQQGALEWLSPADSDLTPVGICNDGQTIAQASKPSAQATI